MFKTKQNKLFETETSKNHRKVPASTVQPLFVQKALKESVVTRSGNGAKKLSSTLDPFVDQFGVIGSYRSPRSFDTIASDCETLWGQDQLDTVRFIGYLRTITRKTQLMDGSTTEAPQKGGEMKHEAIMRMIWLSQKAPETFWNNIGLFISLGSWHDVFTMLQYDLVYNGWEKRVLDWKKFGDLILSGLENKNTSNLVKKYLPQIKAKSNCKTVEAQANCMIAKWICSLLFGPKDNSYNYKNYRKLKTSGTAHEWQQLISQKKFDKIDFDKIHGRALNLLVRSKFLQNQGLEDAYKNWVSDSNTDVKFTGFVHELFNKIPGSLHGLKKHEQDTINKQFDTLVQKAKDDRKENQCDFIVVRDVSGSMHWGTATGTTMTANHIAKSLALYFSEFLTGRFANSWISFSNTAKMHTWNGNTPLEKWYNDKTEAYGGTNFQSVINLFIKLKREGVAEEEFPTGILCLSDGEFNPADLNKTNVETARNNLIQAGFSKEYAESFQIVLWNIHSGYYGSNTGKKFETTANEAGTYYFSGYSASVISFLTGAEILTPRQLFDVAMSQEVLSMMKL